MRCFLLGALALAAALGACSPGAPAARRIERSDFRRPAASPVPAAGTDGAALRDLGRDLFHDARLSGDGSRSCASCHRAEKGWGDGLPRASGLSGRPLATKTPTLLDLAAADGPMGWDGKFAGIDAVAFGPIANPDNMGSSEADALAAIAADAGYVRSFVEAFGEGVVTRQRVEAALGEFVRGLASGPGRFDRWVAGDESALTANERNGFDVFRGKGGCAACHSGWAMTDGSFHDVGVGAEPGRGRLFPGSIRLQHAWKTPGLREIGRRAPYMHDGSLPTLEAVVDHYDAGGRVARPSLAPEMRPLLLTPTEKADLVAFLKTLDADPAGSHAHARRRAAEAKEQDDGHDR